MYLPPSEACRQLSEPHLIDPAPAPLHGALEKLLTTSAGSVHAAHHAEQCGASGGHGPFWGDRAQGRGPASLEPPMPYGGALSGLAPLQQPHLCLGTRVGALPPAARVL